MVYMQSGQGLFAFNVGCRTQVGHCTPVWSNPNAVAGYSAPTFANGFLYVGTQSGQLQAYDVGACASAGGTCAPDWRASLGGEPNSSPAVSKGVVYIAAP